MVDSYTWPALAPDLQELCRRVQACEDELEPWRRGLIATAVHRDLADRSVGRRKAEVVARCLEEIPPRLLPGDRFAGFVARRLRVHQGVSDEDGWRRTAMYPDFHGACTDERVPASVRTELAWWRGRDPGFGGADPHAAERDAMAAVGLARPHGRVNGHTLPDYGILLDAGLAGLRERVADRSRAPCTPAQADLLAGMDRMLAGLQAYARACAEAAAVAARTASGPARARLDRLAADCRHLVAHAPETYAQALQLVIWGHTADCLDNRGDASSFGRLDQLLLPFHRADLTAGRIDGQEAFALTVGFLARTWGRQTSYNLCLGGLRSDGGDGTNPVSHLFLQAMGASGLTTDISVRVHPGTPPDFLYLVARVQRLALGRAGIWNDAVAVPALVAHGVEEVDARDYAPLGCAEVMIPGRSSYRTMGFDLNPLKLLELVIHGGRCPVTGRRLWADGPDCRSAAELHREYRRRLREVVATGVRIIRADEADEATSCPRPWLSLLARGGIADACDLTAGQPRYNPVGVTCQAVADLANAFCALRILVDEERRLDLDGLRRLLAADWAGAEPLRREILHRLPRFGRDPAAAAVAAEEAAAFAAAFAGHRGHFGGRFWPMIFGVAAGQTHHAAPLTGATPDGRHRGDPLAMSLQPALRGGRGAITDVLVAGTTLDLGAFPGGVSNVQDCDPRLAAGPEGIERLVGLLRGFLARGGLELSLNFLDVDTLREARRDPERHPQLMVRLFGLSVRFVGLSPELQEAVVARAAAAAGVPG